MSINVFSLKDYSSKRAFEMAGGTNKGAYILVQVTSFGHKVYAGWSDKDVFSRIKQSAKSLFKKKQFVPDFAISYNMGRTFGNNVVDNTALVEKHLISMLTTAENNHLQVLNTNQRISCNVGHLDEGTVLEETLRAQGISAKMINLIKNHEDEILSAAKPAKKSITQYKAPSSASRNKGLIAERIAQLLINSSAHPTPLTVTHAMNLVEAEFGELGITRAAFYARMTKIRKKLLADNPELVFNLAKQGRVKVQNVSPVTTNASQASVVINVSVPQVSKHKAVIEALEVLILNTQRATTPVLQEEIFNQLKAQGLGTDLSIYNFRQIFRTARNNVYAKNPDVKLNLLKPGQYARVCKQNVNKSNEVLNDTPVQEKSVPVSSKEASAPNYRPRFNFDYNIAPIGNEYFFAFMPIVKSKNI